MVKASERADTTYITNLLNVAVLKFLTAGPTTRVFANGTSAQVWSNLGNNSVYFLIAPRLDPRSSRGHRFHVAWGLFGLPPYFIFRRPKLCRARSAAGPVFQEMDINLFSWFVVPCPSSPVAGSLLLHPLFFLIVLYPYYSFLIVSYIIIQSLSSLLLGAWSPGISSDYKIGTGKAFNLPTTRSCPFLPRVNH